MNIVTGVLNVWNQFKESLMQNFAPFRSKENGTSVIFAPTSTMGEIVTLVLFLVKVSQEI